MCGVWLRLLVEAGAKDEPLSSAIQKYSRARILPARGTVPAGSPPPPLRILPLPPIRARCTHHFRRRTSARSCCHSTPCSENTGQGLSHQWQRPRC